MIVDIHSETLDDAFKQLEEYFSPGFEVLSARIFIDEDCTARAWGATSAAAYLQAQKEIPEGVDVLERKELSQPGTRKLMVEGFDERSAVEKVKKESLAEGEKIVAVKQILPGTKPLLGLIGKKPASYEFTLQVEALVELKYHIQPRIVAALGIQSLEPLGTQYYCYDYPRSILAHIASFLTVNNPRQVLVIGPGARSSVDARQLIKAVPAHYQFHVNEQDQLPWLINTLKKLRRSPESYDIVISSFPTQIEDNSKSSYAPPSAENFGAAASIKPSELLPYPENQNVVDLAVFWVGISPLSYLETVSQIYFKGKTGRRYFQNLVATTDEESLLSKQEYFELRKTRDQTCHNVLPQLIRIYDQQGAEWVGGSLR